MHPSRVPGAGFTILELLVVIAVIVALIGIGFPVMSAVRQRANIQATRSLVQSVTAAISMYPVQRWTVTWDDNNDDPNDDGYVGIGASTVRATPRKSITVPLWDLNPGSSPNANGIGQLDGDGVIDGFVDAAGSATTDGPFWNQLIASGYTGFLRMTNAAIPARSVNKKGQVVDAWREPLRIIWDSRRFAAIGFGVWSTGRDKAPNTADDLTSWGNANE